MHWLAYAILLLLALAGIFVTLLGLPGLWGMVLAALVYAWCTAWHYVGLWTVVALIVIAAAAEVIEFVAGSAGAKSAGGSRRAAWGARDAQGLASRPIRLLVSLPVGMDPRRDFWR